MSTATTTNEHQTAQPDSRLRRRTFGAMVLVYGLALAATIIVVLGHNDGTFTYAVDDTYIHLSIAENLASDGTWGVVADTYESASSAPLWTATLAAGDLLLPTGAVWIPLALNVAASGWLLWSLSGLSVVHRFASSRGVALGVVLLPISLGLVPLTVAGMEHVLHAALVVQILILLRELLRGRSTTGQKVAYYSLLAAGSLVRFETAFVAVGCALALLIAPGPSASGNEPRRSWLRRDRLVPAVATLAVAAIPIVVYALINRSLGGELLPNSVIAKSALSNASLVDLSAIAERAIGDVLVPTGLAICGVLLYAGRGRHRREDAGPLIAVITIAVLFLVFGRVESFWRYQAFVIIAAVYVILSFVGTFSWRSAEQAARFTAASLLVLVIPRLIVLFATGASANNIHDQQYQSARFVSTYYQDRAILVNDLGYVAYLHEGPIIDLAGLGSLEVLEARDAGELTAEFVAEISTRDDVEAAVVFESYFGGLVPDDWVRVRRWCLTGTVVTNSEPCVTWFAPTPEGASELADHLDAFEPSLPASVLVVTPEEIDAEG